MSSGAPRRLRRMVSSRALHAFRAKSSKAASLAAFASSSRAPRFPRPGGDTTSRSLGHGRGWLEARLAAGGASRRGIVAHEAAAARVPGHLARGEDALDLEVEVIRIGRGIPRRLVGDELLAVESQERLVEGLHAVLGLAGGDHVGNLRRLGLL